MIFLRFLLHFTLHFRNSTGPHPGILEKFQIFKMAAGKWQYRTNQYNFSVLVVLENIVSKLAYTLN